MRSATKKRTGKDKNYLAWIHTLPCVVCWSACYESGSIWGFLVDGWEPAIFVIDIGASTRGCIQESRTEAAHVGDRGSSQKCPDREAIPLCAEHHRTGKDSHHVLQRAFWAHHKLDRDSLIASLQLKYEAERAAA